MKRFFVFLIGSVVLLASCATSPEGRSQLMLMPDQQMDAMGATAFNDIKAQTPTVGDAQTKKYVQCISDLLLRQIPDGSGWEIQVFQSDDVNAFALPGKKIGVYTGLLKVARTPSQLATVIGHEIGHVQARHGNERVSAALVSQLGLAAVQQVMTQKSGPNYNLLMGALGLGVQFGVLLPHGRTQESEADMIGLDLMAKAGFDPRESVTLWQNMGKASGGQPPEFMSTHPSHSTRIGDLQERMTEALALYQASPYRQQAKNCQ